MTSPLNLLIIEDSEADFLLVQRSLKQHGVEADFHRVDNNAVLSQALDTSRWDAILSDYHLPGMDFRSILGLIRNKVPDIPVILVSGSIGEEEAVDLLRQGLSDFVLKDRPARLAGALKHSLETARVRKAQRTAEAALIESEARFSTIFRSSPLGIGLSRYSDAKFVEVNEALLGLIGRSREEVIGKTSIELGLFLHPEDRDRLIERLHSGGRARNFQFQNRKEDGSLRDLLISSERIQLGGEDYLLGMVSDITPLKSAERALQASEGRYRSLFENMSEAFVHCRLISVDGNPSDWEYLSVNPAYARVTGLQNVVGRRGSELIPELQRDNPELFKILGEVVRSGVPAKFETFLSSLGVWFSVSAYRPADGEFVAILDDITDRKLAEVALRTSEARFLAVFKASPVGILLSRLRDGEIIDANPAFLDLTGYRLEEILGHTSFDLNLWVRPEVREEGLRLVRETGHLRSMDADLWTCSKEMVSVIWSTELVELGGEKVLVNLIQDQTERRKAEVERRQLEAEVAHAQKLESLGALAGGISHDMNNVLAAVMALGSMLKERYKDDPSMSSHMDSLLHAAGRGRDLVKGLTDFARKGVFEPKPIDLNEVIRKEAALLHRTTLQKVKVDVTLHEDVPYVMGDASSIANVLMNLCVNAMDAMPIGGRLTLTTRILEGGGVGISVKDTGQGMPPDVLKRAMEPFFTTKPAGKGTGLGLSLVYGVMKSHGGSVEILSEVGRGTEIILSFPCLQSEDLSTIRTSQLDPGNMRRIKILLVDDDDLIRSTVPAMLEALGHEVVTLSGGQEALNHLNSGLGPDLVILDLSMPGMDGGETLARLRSLRPNLPVLLATGYRDERIGQILEQFSGVEVMMKPFTLMDLKVKLAQIERDGP